LTCRRLKTSFSCRGAASLALFFTSTPLAQRRDIVTVKNKRVALVIGNATYKESPLSNPVNDARDMAQLLGELGFEVIYKQNASRAGMKSAIREFGNNIIRGWEESGVTGDRRDNFSVYCPDISKVITTGMFSIKLKDKKFNQKGRVLLSFLLPDQLTVAEVVGVIKSACPGVKIDPLF
jgi:hypothetical protein